VFGTSARGRLSFNLFGDVYIKSTLISAASSINANIHAMANIESILRQLRDERDQLDRAIDALSPVSRTGDGAQTVRSAGRRLSEASIAKMRAAQHARRARERSHTHSAKNGQSRARRRISPAGLARIRAAQRARWAKVRAAKKK
jgi:ABC-type transporter Mla subunit MlaD